MFAKQALIPFGNVLMTLGIKIVDEVSAVDVEGSISDFAVALRS